MVAAVGRAKDSPPGLLSLSCPRQSHPPTMLMLGVSGQAAAGGTSESQGIASSTHLKGLKEG